MKGVFNTEYYDHFEQYDRWASLPPSGQTHTTNMAPTSTRPPLHQVQGHGNASSDLSISSSVTLHAILKGHTLPGCKVPVKSQPHDGVY